MKIGPLEISWRKPAPESRRVIRSFSELTSGNTNILSDWFLSGNHINDDVERYLPKLVKIARDFDDDNEYMQAFLRLWEVNVVGPNGMRFESKVSRANGNPDKPRRKLIQDLYTEWQQSKDVLVTADMCFRDARALEERTFVRDGNAFLWKRHNFANKWNFALQLIDYDYLALSLRKTFPTGNRIINGKEINQDGRVVRYWFEGRHPGVEVIKFDGREFFSVPAAQIIHRFDKKRPEQLLGYPHVAAAVLKFRHLAKGEEAELVASRIAAMACISVESDTPEPFTADDEEQDSSKTLELGVGATLTPPMGKKITLINPTHPNGNFSQFHMSVLRGAASALGVSFSELASDFTGENYSVSRAAKLVATANWRVIQNKSIEQSERCIFEAWLESQIVSGRLDLPLAEFARWKQATWHPRGWEWVDPDKDSKAAERNLRLKLTSRRRILAQTLGITPEELQEEIEQDEEILGKLNMDSGNSVGQNGNQSSNDDDTNAAKDDSEDDEQAA